MAHYLVVAHQTSASPELIDKLHEIENADTVAQFTLLVPATPVSRLLAWEEGESIELARRRSVESRQVLESAGFPIVDAQVGAHDPADAVAGAVGNCPEYAAIVVSTFERGVSDWLKANLPARLQRMFPAIPVIHVESKRPMAVLATAPGGHLSDALL